MTVVEQTPNKTTELVLAMKDSSIGIEMGLAILLGVLLGRWLDTRFGTEPWLLLVCLGFGVAAAFNAVLRVSRTEKRKAQARRTQQYSPVDETTDRAAS